MQHAALARAFVALAITTGIIAGTAQPAASTTPSTNASAGRFSATYVDPYRVYGATDARLDAMFAAQKKVGMTTAIVQWTGWVYDDGSVATTYPTTKFRSFDTVLPRLLASAKRNGVAVWLGLAVQYDLFDADATKASTATFAHHVAVDRTLAADLLAKYRGQFAGWYIPSEPGYQSVASTTVQRVETSFLRSLTTMLAAQRTKLPTMISPCVPRATEGGLTGTQFVDRLAPMIRGAGIDVWNMQDGYAMTAWTPAANLAMLRAAKTVAAGAHTTVWATLYTPGPGDAGSMSAAGLFADLDTIRAAGVPITTWTFDSAFYPSASTPATGSAAPRTAATSVRSALYRAYAAHVGARI